MDKTCPVLLTKVICVIVELFSQTKVIQRIDVTGFTKTIPNGTKTEIQFKT